jgi:hypothetical protein
LIGEPARGDALLSTMSEPASPPAGQASPRPRAALGLTALWLLSLLGLLPLVGFAWRFTRGYFEVRFGKTPLERRLTIGGAKHFRPVFQEFCERVRRATPPDARILVEPSEIKTEAGSARWFLYLNLELHPRQVFVREPLLASGTLVDYPRWLEANLRTLDFAENLGLLEAVDALEIGWRLRYPVAAQWKLEALEFQRRDPSGWQPVALAPAGILRGRAPAAEDDSEEVSGGF